MRVLLICVGFSGLLGQTRMIPHITSADGGFSTQVLAYNDTLDPQPVTLLPYKADGTAGAVITQTLAAKSAQTFAIEDLFGAFESSHFQVIQTSDDVHLAVTYAFDAGGGSPAQVGETSDARTLWRLTPGNWELVFDGIAVVNMGDQPTNIEVTQFGSSGSTLHTAMVATDLAPRAKALAVIGGPQGSEFVPDNETFFEIAADQPIAITALRGTPPDAEQGTLWENPPLFEIESPGQPLYLPHLTRADGGFQTLIDIQNSSNSASTLTFIPFLEDGTRLNRRALQLDPHSFRSFSPGTIFGRDDVSHAILERDSGAVRVCASYQKDQGLGSPAQVCASSQFGTTWLMYPGNWDLVFDGFAAVNLSFHPNTIYVQQLTLVDGDPVPISCIRALSDVPPLGKGLFVLGGPNGGPFDAVEDAFFKVYARLPIAIVGLRGTVPGSDVGILWRNHTDALGEMSIRENPLCQDQETAFYSRTPAAVHYARRVPPSGNKISDNQILIETYNDRDDGASVHFTGKVLIDGGASKRELPFDVNVAPGQQSDILPGYITVDDVCDTSLSFPSEGHVNNQIFTRNPFAPARVGPGNQVANQLWGDWFLVDNANQRAQGDLLVQLESNACDGVHFNDPLSTGQTGGGTILNSCDRGSSGTGYTFYGRYTTTTPGKRRVHPLDAVYPCGDIEDGVVLCPPQETEPAIGEPFVTLYATYLDRIPLNDPSLSFQYGFVFDTDNNPNNNWVPAPSFPKDYFQGTDVWYVAEYTPNSGWQFHVRSVKNGSIQEIASGARLVIQDNAMVIRIPLSEFEVDDPQYRITSFAHSGDFGAGGTWSADVDPWVDAPLLRLARD